MASKQIGRPAEVDPGHVARTAMRLFSENGFASVTMDSIALEVGVHRRTLFRYFSSKNELVWGELADALARLEHELADVPHGDDPLNAAESAYVRALHFPDEDLSFLRQRLHLIASDDDLYAHGLRGRKTAQRIIADFLAARGGHDVDGLLVTMQSTAVVDTGYAALLWWSRFSEDAPSRVVARAFEVSRRKL